MYGRFAPEDEEEDEPVVRPVSKSKPPSSKPRAVSLSPPPVQKPRSMSQTQLRASKSKAAESHIEYESGDGLKVVDISTDDEGPQTAAPKSKGKGKAKSKADVEVQLQPAVEDEEVLVQTQPDSPLPSPRAEFPMDDGNDDDVEMAEVEDSIVEPESLPATPPRAAAPARSVLADEDSKRPASPHGSAFIPPLATDPFVNINELSEAEQDMTVEEWIRYQMGIEYERFKRDGSGSLGCLSGGRRR
ncbi:hypothetical protein C8J57DRAFT_90427 [Mycena rebaudengoi]|nr:hypothetical protein C8J57DRAFT_90427 [Mycena rebaudengoi]